MFVIKINKEVILSVKEARHSVALFATSMQSLTWCMPSFPALSSRGGTMFAALLVLLLFLLFAHSQCHMCRIHSVTCKLSWVSQAVGYLLSPSGCLGIRRFLLAFLSHPKVPVKLQFPQGNSLHTYISYWGCPDSICRCHWKLPSQDPIYLQCPAADHGWSPRDVGCTWLGFQAFPSFLQLPVIGRSCEWIWALAEVHRPGFGQEGPFICVLPVYGQMSTVLDPHVGQKESYPSAFSLCCFVFAKPPFFFSLQVLG